MAKVMNVDFARSGNLPLMLALKTALGEDLHYCEFYNHCHKVGCSDDKCNFQKNHDFNLDLDIPQGWKHVITLRRNRRDSLEAWFKTDLNKPFLDKLFGYRIVDNKQRYIEMRKRFQEKWEEKWLNSNGVIIYYEDFLVNLLDATLFVANLIKPGTLVKYSYNKKELDALTERLTRQQIYMRNIYD